MNVCLNLCVYMDNSLVVFWKRFPLPPRFLVKNAKNNIFEDKWFLSKIFYKIKMQAATYWSSYPKKNIIFFQTIDFLRNFQKSLFSEICEKHR